MHLTHSDDGQWQALSKIFVFHFSEIKICFHLTTASILEIIQMMLKPKLSSFRRCSNMIQMNLFLQREREQRQYTNIIPRISMYKCLLNAVCILCLLNSKDPDTQISL